MYMFLVQYTDRHYGSVLEELKALIELDIPYRTFGTIKETNIITGLECLEDLDDSYQYIVRCGTKCLQLFTDGNAEGISDAVKENIKRNIFYNRRNFDQEKYNTPDLPVLNHDAVFCKVHQVLESTFETSKFIKPSEIFTMDLCISDGHIRIVEYNCWHCSGLYAMDIPVLFSSIINLYKERYE